MSTKLPTNGVCTWHSLACAVWATENIIENRISLHLEVAARRKFQYVILTDSNSSSSSNKDEEKQRAQYSFMWAATLQAVGNTALLCLSRSPRWLLLARLQGKAHAPDEYVSAQEKALELQRLLLGRLRGGVADSIKQGKAKATSICFELAEHHRTARAFDKARLCTPMYRVVRTCYAFLT